MTGGGPEHTTLQSEAGYIDARPQSRPIDESLSQRTAAPYIPARRGSDRLMQDANGRIYIAVSSPRRGSKIWTGTAYRVTWSFGFPKNAARS
jgi:hypothetical protein